MGMGERRDGLERNMEGVQNMEVKVSLTNIKRIIYSILREIPGLPSWFRW